MSLAMRTIRAVSLFLLLLILFFQGASCRESPTETVDGETHFLRACRSSGDGCGSGMACVCGVCTQLCSETSMCKSLAESAECVDVTDHSGVVACEHSVSYASCDLRCSTDQQCSALASEYRCMDGFCRAGVSATAAGGAGNAGDGGGAGGGTSAAGSSGSSTAAAGSASACPIDGVPGNEIVVLGDAFIAETHQITAYLEGIARDAGVLPNGERLRDYSSIVKNTLALEGPYVADQYAESKSEGTVRTVIVIAGAADVLKAACDTSDCVEMTNAVTAARQLLAQMAEDGLAHVLWLFYPDPWDSTLATRLNLFKPLLQSECAASEAPCHWLDLGPVFAGHNAEYMLPTGLPTSAGSRATASAIWSAMQEQCIAQ